MKMTKKKKRLVSVKAERPNHPSRGGSASQGGGGVLHDNDDDAHVTPLGGFDLQSRSA